MLLPSAELVPLLLCSGNAADCMLDPQALWNSSLTVKDSAPARSPTPPGLLPGPTGTRTVHHGKIENVPGLTQGGPPSAAIFWPTPNFVGELFPVLTFAHGTGVGGAFTDVSSSYMTLLWTVASQGFIVLAPESCPTLRCGSSFVHDQLATLDAARKNRSLHPALKTADFSRTGAFGHSMGAMSSIAAGGGTLGPRYRPADYNIKAVVAMNPCRDASLTSRSIEVPVMFTSGAADVICKAKCASRLWNHHRGAPVMIHLSIRGASHFEPTDMGDSSERYAIAYFLACYVKGQHCDMVHDSDKLSTDNDICNALTEGHSLTMCDYDFPPVGDSFHCDSWFGRVSVHNPAIPQKVAVCRTLESLYPAGVLLLGVVLTYENFRQLISKRGCRRQGLFPVLVWATSIFPIFFNHYVLFMYVNDRFWSIYKVQLFFTVTDDISLLLRFLDWLPEVRASIHGYHLVFALLFETRPLKYWFFLLDDLSNLLYAIFYQSPETALAYVNVPSNGPSAVEGVATVMGQPYSKEKTLAYMNVPSENPSAVESGVATVAGQPHRFPAVRYMARMRLWLLALSTVGFGAVAALTLLSSTKIS